MNSSDSDNARTFRPRQFATGLLFAGIGLLVLGHLGMEVFNGQAAHLTIAMLIMHVASGVGMVGVGFWKLVAALPNADGVSDPDGPDL